MVRLGPSRTCNNEHLVPHCLREHEERRRDKEREREREREREGKKATNGERTRHRRAHTLPLTPAMTMPKEEHWHMRNAMDMRCFTIELQRLNKVTAAPRPDGPRRFEDAGTQRGGRCAQPCRKQSGVEPTSSRSPAAFCPARIASKASLIKAA